MPPLLGLRVRLRAAEVPSDVAPGPGSAGGGAGEYRCCEPRGFPCSAGQRSKLESNDVKPKEHSTEIMELRFESSLTSSVYGVPPTGQASAGIRIQS